MKLSVNVDIEALFNESFLDEIRAEVKHDILKQIRSGSEYKTFVKKMVDKNIENFMKGFA